MCRKNWFTVKENDFDVQRKTNHWKKEGVSSGKVPGPRPSYFGITLHSSTSCGYMSPAVSFHFTEAVFFLFSSLVAMVVSENSPFMLVSSSLDS